MSERLNPVFMKPDESHYQRAERLAGDIATLEEIISKQHEALLSAVSLLEMCDPVYDLLGSERAQAQAAWDNDMSRINAALKLAQGDG